MPDFFSSANSRIVSMGMKNSRTTLMFENSGRMMFSVGFRLCPNCGFIADCIEALV